MKLGTNYATQWLKGVANPCKSIFWIKDMQQDHTVHKMMMPTYTEQARTLPRAKGDASTNYAGSKEVN